MGKLRVLAVAIVAVAVTPRSAVAETVTKATNTNTALGTAAPINQNPTLMLKQAAINTKPGNPEPISPTYEAADVQGAITAAHPVAFDTRFGTTGQAVNITVTPANTQVTALLLFDPFGNLVAIVTGNGSDGRSAPITSTIPQGDAGTWSIEVTTAGQSSADYFDYTLHAFGPITCIVDTLGDDKSKTGSRFYAIAANANDQLVSSLSPGNPALQTTELLLDDPAGNLVASVSGNAPDGASTLIDFTANRAGTCVAAVDAPKSRENFDYDLRVQGATGAGSVVP